MTNLPVGDVQPCAVHPHGGRRALDGYRVCEPCIREGRQALDDIKRIAATLDEPDALLPRRGSDTARSSSSYRSASPANDALIALTDWRSIAERRGDPDDVWGVVRHWGDRLRTETGLGDSEPYVEQLLRMWHWVCKRDWVGPALWELTNVAAGLREVANETIGRAKLGRCPELLDGLRCGFLLLVRPDADHIACPRCTTWWGRDDWIRLAEQIEAADEWERR